MTTFSITSSAVGKVKDITSATWYFDGASQGIYGNGAPLRLGVILFDGLHNIDWSSQTISKITLTIKYLKSGYSQTKTVGLYEGTQSNISGIGLDMRGKFIGQFVTSSRAYNQTVTDIFDEEENQAVFNGLVSWLKSKISNSLVTYIDETSNYTFSRNYLVIQSVTMDIDYEPAGSGCVLSSNSVLAGNTISCEILPISSNGIVTHDIVWKFKNVQSELFSLGSNLLSSFDIPLDWIAQIPNDNIGTATCQLTTYIDGYINAVREIPFSIIVPDSIVPNFNYLIVPYDTNDGFYQHLGGAAIKFVDIETLYGAQIKSYSIIGSENVFSNSNYYETPKFIESGTHSYSMTIVDSRNRSTTIIADIDVNAVSEPVINKFSVKRYGSYIDDNGITQYRDDMSGGYIWITLDAEIDIANGNNVPYAYITYSPNDSSSYNQVTIPWNQSLASLNIEDDRTIISAVIPLNKSYIFNVYVGDSITSVSAFAQIERSWAPVHVAGSGYGVAFGGYSNGTEISPEVRTYWPLYGPDGFRIDSYIEEKITEFGPNFESYSDLRHPHVMRVGRVVTLTGACKPTANISGSATWYPMFTLPEKFRPVHPINVLCQGSAYHQWAMQINTAGVVEFSCYCAGSSYATADTSALLTFHTSWIAMDVPVETPDDGSDDAELAWFTYPESAMTSDSSQSCVASVSSRQSSTYAAYRAFDNERGNAWTSASGESSAWIQLQMPQALKKISVKAYSWSSSNKYKGDPISGAVMGSNDGALWTTIGTFSGWSEGDGGLLGEVVCDNSDAYSYVRLNITAWTSGKSYVAIGYITITGGVNAV